MIEVFIFIIGAVFGSFGGVLLYRIPRNESIIMPQSHCEQCGAKIKFYNNIPILSYILLRGKCANCGVRITPIYPIIELLSAIIFVIIYLKFGLTLTFVAVSLTFAILLILSAMDFIYMQAPDSLNFLALGFALCSDITNDILETVQNIEAALVLAGLFALLRLFVGYIKKQEALGEADIIVAASLGALLGIHGALSAIFIGSIIALPVALILRLKNQYQLPFIPFLAVGGFAQMVFLQ